MAWLAEHQHVELDAFQLLDLLLSLGEDVAGGQSVGTTASAVGDQVSLVAADRQALLQSGQSLLGAHGQDDNLGVLVLVLDAGSSFECISIEGADDGGNALTHQGVGLGINFDMVVSGTCLMQTSMFISDFPLFLICFILVVVLGLHRNRKTRSICVLSVPLGSRSTPAR